MPALKNPQWEKFAALVASGANLGDAYRCAGYKCATKNAARSSASHLLTKHPEISNRVAELRPGQNALVTDKVAQLVQSARERELTSIAALAGDVFSRAGRAKAAAERRNLLLKVIEARAKYEVEKARPKEEGGDGQPVPGAETGLVVSSMKAAGRELVKTHQVDTAILEEVRATEKQIAQELGQWVERREDRKITAEDVDSEVIADLIKNANRKKAELEARMAEAGLGEPEAVHLQ